MTKYKYFFIEKNNNLKQTIYFLFFLIFFLYQKKDFNLFSIITNFICKLKN